MNVQHQQTRGVDVVSLPQRLIMANASDVRSELKTIIEQGEGRMVIDLSATEYMDSSGLAAIVSALQAARTKQGDVYLAYLNDTLRALFELTQLHKICQIFDDTESAVDAFFLAENKS
ncbi:STAS domain-containing protein [Halochromatium sp.]